MIRLHARCRGAPARLVLQVHDELIVEAPEADAEAVGELMREVMEGVADAARAAARRHRRRTLVGHGQGVR